MLHFFWPAQTWAGSSQLPPIIACQRIPKWLALFLVWFRRLSKTYISLGASSVSPHNQSHISSVKTPTTLDLQPRSRFFLVRHPWCSDLSSQALASCRRLMRCHEGRCHCPRQWNRCWWSGQVLQDYEASVFNYFLVSRSGRISCRLRATWDWSGIRPCRSLDYSLWHTSIVIERIACPH